MDPRIRVPPLKPNSDSMLSDDDQILKVPSLSSLSIPLTGRSTNSSPRSNGSDSARWKSATMHGIGSDGLLSRPLDSKRDGAGFSGGGFNGPAGASASLAAGKIEDTIRNELAGDALLHMLGSSQEELADSLLIGAERGDEAVVEKALKAGVDPNKVSGRNGFTPLHHACSRGHLKVSEMLLLKGASVSAATTDGLETPLHMAAYHGHLSICALLLKNGADPNASGADGESPLFFASRRSRSEVVALLLSSGANMDMLNRYGDRAADDATDDDTIHQFLLHSQQQMKENTTTSLSSNLPISKTLSSSKSSSSLTVKGPTSTSTMTQLGQNEYASRMRASNLKRCLRYLRKAELGRAAMTCSHWKDAALDSRLWKPFGGIPKSLVKTSKKYKANKSISSSNKKF